MFCYLYVMYDRTTVPLYEHESCTEKCNLFKDGKCSIGVTKSKKLTDDRFGWILESVIQFKELRESKSKNSLYISAISLIHPSYSDIWILYCQKKNKKDNNKLIPVFRMYISGDCKEFENFRALNIYLIKKGYDGRPFDIEDFSIEERDEKCI